MTKSIDQTCLATFNNAAEVIEEFITLKNHDQLGGSPSISSVQVFFMERALGYSPNYYKLIPDLIEHQKKQGFPVTVRDNPEFKDEFLDLCDKYINKLECYNPLVAKVA